MFGLHITSSQTDTCHAVVHHLQGALRLNCSVLARIFNFQITSWTHPAIRELNPDLAAVLPGGSGDIPIAVIRRKPGSSSTYGISNYFRL